MRTRKWKESGGFFEAPDARERNHMGWRYCLTVQGNPVEGADDAYHDGSWGGDPGNYDVNIYLRRVYDCDDPSGRHEWFHARCTMAEVLDHCEEHQGCALTVADALSLLRVGLRGGSVGSASSGGMGRSWTPERARVLVDASVPLTRNPDPTSLEVSARDAADGTATTIVLPPGLTSPTSVRFARAKLSVATDNLFDAESGSVMRAKAADRLERHHVRLLLEGAKALREMLASDEETRGAPGVASGRSIAGTRVGISGASPARPDRPPFSFSGDREALKRRAEEAAAAMERAAKEAEERAFGLEMGVDERDVRGTRSGLEGDEDEVERPESLENDGAGRAGGGPGGDGGGPGGDGAGRSPGPPKRRRLGTGLVLRAAVDREAT